MNNLNKQKYSDFLSACGFLAIPDKNGYAFKRDDIKYHARAKSLKDFILTLDDNWFEDVGLNGVKRELLLNDDIETLDECYLSEDEEKVEIEIQFADGWAESLFGYGTQREIDDFKAELELFEKDKGEKYANITVFNGNTSDEYSAVYNKKSALIKEIRSLVEDFLGY